MASIHPLLAACCLMALAGANSISPTVHQRPYANVQYYGNRPQPPVFAERHDPFKASPPINQQPDELDSLSDAEPSEPMMDPSKVIIKPASALTTPRPTRLQQHGTDKQGCSCEKIDYCPIELMDFSFSVSCEYGTVRCCRPLETVVTKEAALTSQPTTVAPTTSTSAIRWPTSRTKKPAMCKCKPRKECDRLVQNADELVHQQQQDDTIDRKDECQVGYVKCCETGNMGNPKESNQKGTQILGISNFRPIQLPYQRLPQNTERISETEPLPPPQELTPINPTVPAVAEIQPTQSADVQPLGVESAQENEQDTVQPAPAIQNFQQPATTPIAQQLPALQAPVLQPTQGQQQPIRPLAVPPQHFSQPIRPQTSHPLPGQLGHAQHQGPLPGFQFQPLGPSPVPGSQLQQRPVAPLRQPTPIQIPQQFQPSLPSQAMIPPQHQFGGHNGQQVFRPSFGLTPPSSSNSFQQQPFRVPSPTQQAPPSPTGQQPSASGGFLSSLISMFN